jgi:hypothetical protein
MKYRKAKYVVFWGLVPVGGGKIYRKGKGS